MKWLTCTPVNFKGDHTFFSRESGLLSLGFHALGVGSRAIMPGEPMPDDDPQLIRTEYKNLEDPKWWEKQGADGVVLYAWGMPAYTPIVKAVKASGAKIISTLDTGGLMTPFVEPFEYIKASFGRNIAAKGYLLGSLLSAASLTRKLNPGSIDLPRLQHFQEADYVVVPSPGALLLVREYCLHYGRVDLSQKLRYIPHPQMKDFEYDGTTKDSIVSVIGRWEKKDWYQKDPLATIKALALFLQERNDYNAKLVGWGASGLAPMVKKYAPTVSKRIELIDYMPAAELKPLYLRSKIGFWASRSEGQQGTAAQALCCGCSVVSKSGLLLTCFHHYVSYGSGRTAIRNTVRNLANALLLEAQAWDEGKRDPRDISRQWMTEFHSDKVAERYLRLESSNS